MTKHQKIAYINLNNAFDWIIGEYYNAIQDEVFEDNRTPQERKDSLFKEIYESALNDNYMNPGRVIYNNPVYEMRFAGTSFLQTVLTELFNRDLDAQEIIYYEN